jgi:hypothetical protein
MGGCGLVSAMNGAVLARIKRHDDSSVGVNFVGTVFYVDGFRRF